MEVAAGVHQLHMLGADTFVIAEERLTLIDAGMVGSRRTLERQLRGMGRSLAELERNLDVLELPPMRKQERGQWERFGDLVYGAGKGKFETS